MRLVIEETRRRVNYLQDHGCYRDHMTFRWGYRGVYYGSFVSMWTRYMQLEHRSTDWVPPVYYDHLDCDRCGNLSLSEISIALKEAIRVAVNRNCSCGGKGPFDPDCCPACKVWHDLYDKKSPAKGN